MFCYNEIASFGVAMSSRRSFDRCGRGQSYRANTSDHLFKFILKNRHFMLFGIYYRYFLYRQVYRAIIRGGPDD